MKNFLSTYKPAVTKKTLLWVGGVVWGFAALMLFVRGIFFLRGDAQLFAVGIFTGIVFFRFVFMGIISKHLGRILSSPLDRPCMFSFLDWRGYAVMTVMITLGVILRTSGVLPPSMIGTIFIAMATPLAASSAKFVQAGMNS